MHPIKLLLFDEIRKNNDVILKKQIFNLTDFSDNGLNATLFLIPSGLRLSLTGFITFKSIFTAYSFEMKINIQAKHRRALAKLEYPYYTTSSRLILFSESDALMIKLCGSVTAFLETF